MGIACACDPTLWHRRVARRRLLAAGAVGAAAPFLARAAFPGGGVAAQTATPLPDGRVLINEGNHAVVINGSFISPLVELYGDVAIGQNSFIAGNTIIFADAEYVVSLGDECNCQDNAYLLATTTDNTFGNMISIAHQAVIEDSLIGDFTFFGFRSRTRHCEIGEGAMIMHNTTVENVVIPPNRITPLGVQITTQAAADALPELVAANIEFKHDVQAVNLEFVTGYTALYEAEGRRAVEGVGPNPLTSLNPTSIMPTIGDGTILRELVRIVGDVRLGDDSQVGQRTAIRADEGSPISIGRRARIGSRVTFHALAGTTLTVGDNASIGDESVIHGPLTIGDGVVIDDQAVVFQATIGDYVTIGRGATIAAPVTIREGAIVPVSAVIATQEDADRLPTA